MSTWRRPLLAVCVWLVANSDKVSVAAEPESSPAPKTGGTIRAFLLPEKPDGTPGKFSTDAPKISAAWRGTGLTAGDRLRVFWIAEDLGIASQRESKITEEAATAYKPDDDGIFTLGRPKEGWPPGKYRLEIYLNGELNQVLRFTVEPGATIEVR